MRNLRSHPTQRRDHYQELTDKIIATLEAGVAPWRRPWDPNACGASTTPVNVASGHGYRGVNMFVLGMSPLAFTSGDPRWCSYRQAARRPIGQGAERSRTDPSPLVGPNEGRFGRTLQPGDILNDSVGSRPR
jgi:hypothetical protein